MFKCLLAYARCEGRAGIDRPGLLHPVTFLRTITMLKTLIIKLNLPAGGLRSPAQKVYILHKKLSLSGALCAKPGRVLERSVLSS
jgi:hypothetical protein